MENSCPFMVIHVRKKNSPITACLVGLRQISLILVEKEKRLHEKERPSLQKMQWGLFLASDFTD